MTRRLSRSQGTLTGYVAEHERKLRRHTPGIAELSSRTPIWLPSNGYDPDMFTITGPVDTDHNLTYLPLGLNAVWLNGVGLSYGTDFTVNWTTGVISVAADIDTDDVLEVWYVTNGSQVEESTGLPPIAFEMFEQYLIDNLVIRNSDGSTWFSDTFTRSDGPPGNGWITTAPVTISSGVLVSSADFVPIGRDDTGLTGRDIQFDFDVLWAEPAQGLQVAVSDSSHAPFYFFNVDLPSSGVIRVTFYYGTFDGATAVDTTGDFSGDRPGTWRFQFDGTTYTATQDSTVQLTGSV